MKKRILKLTALALFGLSAVGSTIYWQRDRVFNRCYQCGNLFGYGLEHNYRHRPMTKLPIMAWPSVEQQSEPAE